MLVTGVILDITDGGIGSFIFGTGEGRGTVKRSGEGARACSGNLLLACPVGPIIMKEALVTWHVVYETDPGVGSALPEVRVYQQTWTVGNIHRSIGYLPLLLQNLGT
ncbi:hypothetical protein NDU88_001302 [Pleurodeles waltl]|uniref:Uncharacterized protein n=1 Tax=Pleurodeles waltl TaxID=8319 RepID=A0AAV7SZ50_PLEWA|nr:hypothetical protein NDU88_001302 [Pleurodeles waltl]